VEVGPLSEAECQQLLGPGTRHTRVAGLHEASGGNPFYLRALAAGDVAANMPAGMEGELPAQVRAVLLAEIAGLSPPAQRVAAAAAVIGDPFEADLIVEVAGLGWLEVGRALDELHARDVVRPHGLSRFAYRHALLRQVVYDSTGAGSRRDAHARAARALQRRGDRLPTCASHVARSAAVGDMSAVALLREAADELHWQAPGSAADLLREGVRLLPADRAGSTDHWDLQLRLARCLAVAGRLHDARDAAHELLHQLPGGEGRRPPAVALAAMTERLLGNHPQARALLLHELGTLQEAATAASLELELGLGALLAGDFSVDRAMIGDAYRTACGLGNLPLRAHSAALVALADYAAGAITAAQSGADSAAARRRTA
jgi:hypothetical protein